MNKRQVVVNAIMSVVHVVVISGVVFILYRFLLRTMGVEQLGIWSLILATTGVSQIGSLGMSQSAVKFVAKYVASGQDERVSALIQTAALSVGAVVGLTLVIGYPLAKWILGLVIAEEYLPKALGILPYALLALWIGGIAGVFQGALDGLQRIDIRNSLLVGGGIIHLLLCLILAPRYGLVGLAFARIIQNIAMLLSTSLLLKRCLPLLPILPYKWRPDVFNELVRYGAKYQMISVTVMFYDPVTKGLLSRFGGLSMLGYYEMANRLIQQLRALVVSTNQVIVPVVAGLREEVPERIRLVYLVSYQLVFYLALPLYSLIIVFTPVISRLWIGYYEVGFVLCSLLLAMGWFVNTLAGPAYFANLGAGELRWNVMGHFAIAVLNVGLGFLLGLFYDGLGVTIAWMLSLALGSSVIYLSYHIQHRIPLTELLPRSSRILTVGCLGSIVATISANYFIDHSISAVRTEAIVAAVFLLLVFFFSWLHPMRRQLIEWVFYELLNKAGKASEKASALERLR